MYVELLKGQNRSYWHRVAQNKSIVATSQNHYSRFNAKRAAEKFAKANGWQVRERG
jgi:hypothetical protein